MWKKFLKQLDFPESYISITLGFLVVIAGGLLFYRYLTNKNQNNTTPTKDITFEEQKPDEAKVELPATYTVLENDSLWKIAEKFYGSGYNWVSIVSANQIKNSDKIAVGQTLTIPKAEVIRPESEKVLSTSTQVEKTYTVVTGDYLWKIALKEYGDGYAWTKIANANNLKNPDLIYPGTILKLPN